MVGLLNGFLIFFLLCVCWAFVVWMLVHIVKSKKISLLEKIFWIVILFSFVLIKLSFYSYYFFAGAFLYGVLGSKNIRLKYVSIALICLNTFGLLSWSFFGAKNMMSYSDHLIDRYAKAMVHRLGEPVLSGNKNISQIKQQFKKIIKAKNNGEISVTDLAGVSQLLDWSLLDNRLTSKEKSNWDKYTLNINKENTQKLTKHLEKLGRLIDVKSPSYKQNGVYDNLESKYKFIK